MQKTDSVITLLDKEFFPWGGFPYPCEHAKLGIELAERGEWESVKKMAAFQQATLDHEKKPLFSFFRQEKGCSYSELEIVNRQFFETAGIEPETDCRFIDPELGILVYRSSKQTLACFGSGCKSGTGIFLVGDGGIINFGPQLRPLGECSGFGLAGRGKHIEVSGSSLHFQCRLSAPHKRDTGIPWLQDSGYSGAWIESQILLENNNMKVTCQLEGFRPLSDFIFTFFGKAKSCLIAGSHKLSPRSLDRYLGPSQRVILDEVEIIPENGFSSMEVVPLAGDESYWGADFLVAFTLERTEFQFALHAL